MEPLAGMLTDLLWRNALAVVPLALLVAGICRWMPCHAGTRHTLWLVTLLWLGVSPFLPAYPGSSRGPDVAVTPPAGVAVAPAPRPPETDSPPVSAPSSAEPAVGPAPRAGEAELYISDRDPPPDRLADASAGSPAATSSAEPQTPPPPDEADAVAWAVAPAAPADGQAPAARLAPAPMPEHAIETPTAAGASWVAPIVRWSSGVPDLLSGLFALRDTLAGRSPIPVWLWLAGTGALAAVQLLAVLAFRRRLRRTVAAPPAVSNLVRQAADHMGLRGPPCVRMAAGRLSPLVWCGRQRLLILPTVLWQELDDVGRRAVVYHELAHLRRRDHWVRWADLIVGTLYWWHPVVWWIRGRLRAEAESCCDAWVTWLLPRGRRAYAEALLTTRQFVSDRPVLSPAVGMGVTTRPARRFARRITMVMTKMETPWLTRKGIVLAAAVALAGWLATPAQSCPPRKNCEKKCDHAGKKVKCESADSEDGWVRVEDAGGAPVLLVGGGRGGTGQHKKELVQRIETLEKQIARLSEQMEKMSRVLGGTPAGLPPAPQPPRAPSAWTAPAPDNDQIVIRSYELPKGQLQALTSLMVRQDVPVLVSPGDDHITVHATEAHHQIFKAFVNLISGKETEWHAPAAGTFFGAAGEYLKKTPKAKKIKRGKYASGRTEYEVKKAALRKKTREARSEAREARSTLRAVERTAIGLEREAAELQKKAEHLRQEAGVLRGDMEDSTAGKRQALKQKLKAVEQAIKEIDRAIDKSHQAIQELAEKTAVLEAEAAECEARSEQLEAEMEEYAAAGTRD